MKTQHVVNRYLSLIDLRLLEQRFGTDEGGAKISL